MVVLGTKEELAAADVVAELLVVEVAGKTFGAVRNLEVERTAAAAEELVDAVVEEVGMIEPELAQETRAVVEVDTSIGLVVERLKEEERNVVAVLVVLAGQNLEGLYPVSWEL